MTFARISMAPSSRRSLLADAHLVDVLFGAVIASALACSPSPSQPGTGQPATGPATTPGGPATPASTGSGAKGPGGIEPTPPSTSPPSTTPPETSPPSTSPPSTSPPSTSPPSTSPPSSTLPMACPNGPAAGSAPIAYVGSCSGCHGATASGQRYYPTLRNPALKLADVQAVVRAGRVGKATVTTAEGKTINATMPAFSPDRVSDADIAAIFAYMQTPVAAAAPSDAYCIPTPETTWTQDQIETAYQRGLKAWRTPGSVDNNACVFCHGPDAMEFAFIGYTDGQIYRRAFSHVTQDVADGVVDMVHALRARYRVTQPPNPATFRPFQPGGTVLPGASSAERDKEFGEELKRHDLTLINGTVINSAADARKAYDELVALNLRQLRTGIPLNRWTEDIFNNGDATMKPCADVQLCDDHGTIADWIPDVAQLTPATFATVQPLHDAYLASPSLDTLKNILNGIPRNEFYWISSKYSSVQIGSHFFRMQAMGGMSMDQVPPMTFDVEKGHLLNSMWMVGANTRDFAHNGGGGTSALPVGGGNFAIPKASSLGLTFNAANQHLARMEVPWFWLGWTLDPSTLNTRDDYVAEASEYFTEQTFLDNGSYPIHAAFIVSKRTVSVMALGTLPRAPHVFPFYHPDKGTFAVTPMTMRAGYFPELVNFAEAKNFDAIDDKQLKYMPTDPAHKALYQLYSANMYRMFLWMLVDDLQKDPSVWNKTMLLGKINKAEIFLKVPEVVAANGDKDAALVAQARMLVGAAKVN
jgi:cytochrome c553